MQQHGVKYVIRRHTLDPGVWQKDQNIFSESRLVMLHIKLKEVEHRAPCKHMFCLYTDSQP